MKKNELKHQILRLRLEGEGVHGIGEKLGVSFQYVSAFLRTFPVKEGSNTYTFLPAETMYEICVKYVEGLSPIAIALESGVEISDVYDVFNVISKPCRMFPQDPAYPALVRWMRVHGFDVKNFSAMLGITPAKLSRIIHGTNDLPYKMANKIKRITGLSLTELYAHVDDISGSACS